MHPAQEIFGGPWVRFSRYEIRAGDIRPAGGAVPEIYDPWKTYRDRRDAEQPPPYRDLLDLARHVRRGARLQLARDAEPAVLEFCRHWGLLGVLPHRAALVRLAPRWERADPPVTMKPSPAAQINPRRKRPANREPGQVELLARLDALGLQLDQMTLAMSFNGRPAYVADEQATVIGVAWAPSAEPPPIVPRAKEYMRTNLGWQTALREFKIPDGVSVGEIGAVVPVKRLVDQARPYVLMQRRWMLGLDREALDWNWSSFFPDVPGDGLETYDYPVPLTDEFWRQYGEPIPQFISAVDAFREAVEGLLAAPTSPTPPIPETDPRSALYRINALLAPLSPSSMPGQHGRKLFWSTPSLLASFALMAVNDDTHAALRRCPGCDEVFFPVGAPTIFCSDTCQDRHQKREQRRHQAAERMHDAGTPVAEIAEQLKAPEHEVAQWIERRKLIARAQELHEAGRSPAEVAADLSVSETQAAAWIEQRRGKSRHRRGAPSKPATAG